MARYYTFLKGNTFVKSTSLRSALSFAKGDEKKVYKHVGFPNPWWVFPVKAGKVDRTTMVFLSGGKRKRTVKLPAPLLDK